MANFSGTARSNYFLVKDEAAFRAWCARLDLKVLEGTDKQAGMFGFYSTNEDDGCFPTNLSDDGDGEDVEVYVTLELAAHLADGQVAVLMEAGAEKAKYISGWAEAVHSDGRIVRVCLHDIYQLAMDTFGAYPTDATY